MDYAALATEIALPAYVGLNDAEIAATLNAKTVDVAVPVSSVTVRGTLYARGAWRNIVSLSLESKSADATHDAALVAAVQLVDFCRTSEDFHTEMSAILAQTTADLDALVTQGTITADDRAAVLALTTAAIPYLRTSGICSAAEPAFVGALDIAAARTL